MTDFEAINNFIRETFDTKEFIPLHAPTFRGNEKKYLNECIDTTFVSSVGKFVDRFEEDLARITGTSKAVAIVNGTSGLQVALRLAGVKQGDEVITQALSFIATSNAITYLGAVPVYLDVDRDTMGLSPVAVSDFLEEFAEMREDGCYNKVTNRKISACVPMHTFGFPVKLTALMVVCSKWKIDLIEDAAESLGSFYKGKHTGGFGKIGVFSFNGNKIVTSGGGGALVSNDIQLAEKGKYLTTTAKVPHPYEFFHDEVGYNFRMPNINAALLCAQLEQLDSFLENKRNLAALYSDYFRKIGINFRTEAEDTRANYWLMCIELENKAARDSFLKISNGQNIMSRPIWQLMFRLPMYDKCYRDSQENALYLEERIVNIPSSVRA